MGEAAKILALDIATSTGWAFGEVGQAVPQSGSEMICKPSASTGARVGQAIKFMARMLERFDPDIVYIEKRISSGAHMSARSGAANNALSELDHGIQGLNWNMKKDGRFRPLEEVCSIDGSRIFHKCW